MTFGRLAVLAGALLAAFLFVRASAQTPIQFEMGLAEDSDGACTAGRMAEVHWNVMGGSQTVTEARIDEIPQEGASGVVQVECGALPADWEIWAARYGTLPTRVVAGQALAANGQRAAAQVRLRIQPPPPPPMVASAIADMQAGTFQVAIERPSAILADADQVWVALRWRRIGAEQWRVDADPYEWEWRSDDLFPAEARAWLAEGEYEVQAALLRRLAEAGQPDRLAWSEPPARMTVAPPLDITAVATSDSITVLLPDGIGPEDARYELYGPGALHAVDSAMTDRVTWTGLIPGERYLILAQRVREGVRGSVVGFKLNTEPDVQGQALPPDSWGIASAETFPDRIELSWRPPAGAESTPYDIYAFAWGGGEPVDHGMAFAWRGLDPYYPRGQIISPWRSWYAVRHVEVPAAPEHRVAVDGLRPGSTYIVHVVRRTATGAISGSRLLLSTPERAEGSGGTLPAPPPPSIEFDAHPAGGCYGLPAPAFIVSVGYSGDWDAVEYEWEVDGRRARRVVEGVEARTLRVRLSRVGTYVFRVRGNHGGSWSAWSAPVRTGPQPAFPVLFSQFRRTREGVRLNWYYPWVDPAPGPNWQVLRWSIDGGEPREEKIVRDARGFVVPVPPEWEGEVQATLTGVHREYGENRSDSVDLEVQHSDLRARVSVAHAGCRPLAGWHSEMWVNIWGGVAPYLFRAAGIEETFGKIFDGRFERRLEFDCGSVPEDGLLPWEVIDAAGTVLAGSSPVEMFGLGGDGARLQRPEWAIAEAGRTSITAGWHCLDAAHETVLPYRQPHLTHWPYALRWRKAPDGAWRYMNAGTGAWDQPCFVQLQDLDSDAEYILQVAGYRRGAEMPHPDSLNWSSPLTVRTAGAAPQARVVRTGDRIAVSWEPRSSAIQHLIVLRGEGRSWWWLAHATGGGIEQIEFPLPASGEYAVEVIPAPGDLGEFWTVVRPQRFPLPGDGC